jgi:fused signal recognition particle receptor
MSSTGILAKLRASLAQGRAWLTRDLVLGGETWDASALEELESRLLLADVGVEATDWLIERLRRSRAHRDGGGAAAQLTRLVAELLTTVEQPFVVPDDIRPFVVLVVGVNGTGKTTTIGKLAARFHAAGLSVLLAAGDTYRAAAIEQLGEWGERTGAVVAAQSSGADPAAVVFDALSTAQRRGTDIVIADTAGRLHTAANLMEELKKVKRVVSRFDPTAPHETLLVIDASQGQNALAQAREFDKALGLTGLVITKLDGTAKGGILLAIARQQKIPVRFLAVGESADDLLPFDAAAFAEALVGAEQA